MNPMKAQVKMLTVEALGNDMDDLLEGSRVTLHKAAGGVEYLAKAAEGIRSVALSVDRDLDEGKITDRMGAIEVAKYVKSKLSHAGQSLNDIALQAQSAKLAADGQAAGIKKCVALAKKVFDAEGLKLEASLVQMEKAKAEGRESEGPRPRSNARADDLTARKAKARATKKKATQKRAPRKTAKKTTARKKRSASKS